MRSQAILTTDTKGLSRILLIGAVALAAIPFYRWSWGTEPPDMAEFLVPWFRHIVEAGQLNSFAVPFSNYTPPYLYLLSAASLFDGLAAPATIIRTLSLVITAALALALRSLLRAAGRDSPIAPLMLFAVPTVIINAALLGQCDALWAAACLLAVASAIDRSPTRMLIWCGIAFAIKAQAIFLAPFALGALLAMGPRWHHWLVAPAAYLACMIPALAMGWPLDHILTIYLNQTAHFAGQTSVGAANPWMMLAYAGVRSPIIVPLASGLAILAAAFSSWAVWRTFRTAGPADIIALALLPALALPYLLPMMHERYFFLADILAIALAFTARDLRAVIIAAAVQLGSTLSLFAYITGETTRHLDRLPDPGVPLLGLGAFVAISAALALTLTRVIPRS